MLNAGPKYRGEDPHVVALRLYLDDSFNDIAHALKKRQPIQPTVTYIRNVYGQHIYAYTPYIEPGTPVFIEIGEFEIFEWRDIVRDMIFAPVVHVEHCYITDDYFNDYSNKLHTLIYHQ